MLHWKALGAALIAPLALAACVFVPGKFESSLSIRADRSFTFAYRGEVLAVDVAAGMGKAMAKGMAEGLAEAGDDKAEAEKPGEEQAEPSAEEKAAKDAEYRELASVIAKEAGYRAVEYRGDGLFWIDYAISGRLTHNFLFPYNQDAKMVFPFVTVELRGKEGVRVKAPGFARQDSSEMGGMGGMGGDGASKLDGVFTLSTDAEIVSQNNEDGATADGAMKTIRWKVNARTDDAPMAVLRVAGI